MQLHTTLPISIHSGKHKSSHTQKSSNDEVQRERAEIVQARVTIFLWLLISICATTVV
jgi:hypothetical protein